MIIDQWLIYRWETHWIYSSWSFWQYSFIYWKERTKALWQMKREVTRFIRIFISSLDIHTHTLTRSELWTVVPRPSATCKIWVIPSASSPAWCRTPASTTARASSRMSGQSSASTIPTSMTSPENSSSTGSGSHGWQTTSWGQWSTILPQYC